MHHQNHHRHHHHHLHLCFRSPNNPLPLSLFLCVWKSCSQLYLISYSNKN
uniref:Uncharacterized protein n=1 Tax=Rhizophora mucronata TaxID=61149 RepID=A0A2P2N601_RHIMU